jgi:hypothetical protein
MSAILRKLLTRYFAPQPDITAYEVAQLLSLAAKIDRNHGLLFRDEFWDEMKPELKRHFTEQKPK